MAIIQDNGVSGLSMRRLADKVQVSRTAPYHHFSDKHALLCALAEQGFREFSTCMSGVQGHDQPDEILGYVHSYIRFAAAEPEKYDLMFGQIVWKGGKPTASLTIAAHEAFRHYVERVGHWQQQGLVPDGCDTLRLAQVTWSTLHGLSRLLIDGIYLDNNALEEIIQTACQLFSQQLKHAV